MHQGELLVPRYDLRWCLEFANKTARRSQWSRSSNNKDEMAYSVNLNGLVSASIEARNVVTMEEFKLAECAPEDYCLFKWTAARTQTYTAQHHMVNSVQYMTGLSLVTRDVVLECYFDGSTIVTPRTNEDKAFHYAAYGR